MRLGVGSLSILVSTEVVMVVALGFAFGIERFIVGAREDELSRVFACFLLWFFLEGTGAWCRLHVFLIVKHE